MPTNEERRKVAKDVSDLANMSPEVVDLVALAKRLGLESPLGHSMYVASIRSVIRLEDLIEPQERRFCRSCGYPLDGAGVDLLPFVLREGGRMSIRKYECQYVGSHLKICAKPERCIESVSFGDVEYFPERTCEIVADEVNYAHCSLCGYQYDYHDCTGIGCAGDEDEYEFEYNGNYCKNCGARIVDNG